MVVGGFVFILTNYPDVGPAPQIDVARTPAQIERGQYLAEQVTVCQACHTPRDYSLFAGPIKQTRRAGRPMTRVEEKIMKYQTQKVAYAYFVCAMALFGIQVLGGLLALGGVLVLRRRRVSFAVLLLGSVLLVLPSCGSSGGGDTITKAPPPFKLPPLVPRNGYDGHPYPVTGGPPAVNIVPMGGTPPFTFQLSGGPYEVWQPLQVYYLTLAFAFLTYLLLQGVITSRYGTVVRAIRDDADRVTFFGYDTVKPFEIFNFGILFEHTFFEVVFNCIFPFFNGKIVNIF